MAEAQTPGDAGSSGTTAEEATEDTLGALDILLDVATDKCIEEDNSNRVVDSEAEIWEWMSAMGYGSSTDAVKSGDRVTNHGNGSVTTEVSDAHDGDDGKITWYIRGEAAWKDVRSDFEYVKTTVDSALSFTGDGLDGAVARMAMTREDLTPGSNMADNADLLLSLDISEDDAKEKLAGAFEPSGKWSAAPKVSEALAGWSGVAAETFRGVYVDRIPSIATGQMAVVLVLEQSISTVASAFKNLRSETARLISDVTEYLELYPDSGSAETGGIKWATVMSSVSGVATIVAGAAAPAPGPGTAISAVATIVAGGASLGAVVLEDPEYQEAESTEIHVEGDTVTAIVSSFNRRVAKYIDMAENTEKVMAKTVQGYETFFTDASAPGVTIQRTYTDDPLTLSQYHSFFALQEPALGNITASSSYDEVTDTDLMGTAPDDGKSFGVDLERLLKAGHQYLPDIAATFENMAGKRVDDGLQDAFSRQSRGYNDAAGEYTTAETGPFLPAWTSLHEALNDMLSNTGKNLNTAADGLVTAVDVYAAADEGAAADLRKNSNFYDQ